MRGQWIRHQKRDSIIVFCNGWGMDNTPFLPLEAEEFDILNLFSYHDNDMIDVENLFGHYRNRILIGWSMGVFFGQQYFEKYKDNFQKCIAINGTLCPIDDIFGIPKDIFVSTLQNLDDDSLRKFFHRMCKIPGLYKEFLKNRPKRDIKDQIKELQYIQENTSCCAEIDSIYSDIIISDKDFIIPTANQLNFWQQSAVHTIECSHFPFYMWKSWDDLIQTVC